MQKSDVVKLFKAITSAYPGEKGFSSADMDAVNIWAAMLGDIPYERVILALQAHISESPYPPKISDIRKWALSPPMPDLTAAWGYVARAIRDYGYNNPDKALASMPEDVRFVVKQLGWTDLCLSENAMADRAHFLKIYANHRANKARMSTLPPAVRAALPEKGDTHDEKQTLSLRSPREANH